MPLFVNEPYYDTLSKRPETKGEGEEEAAAPVPFRPSHPMKVRHPSLPPVHQTVPPSRGEHQDTRT